MLDDIYQLALAAPAVCAVQYSRQVVDAVVPRQLSVAEVERQSLQVHTRARTHASIIYGIREVSEPHCLERTPHPCHYFAQFTK